MFQSFEHSYRGGNGRLKTLSWLRKCLVVRLQYIETNGTIITFVLLPFDNIILQALDKPPQRLIFNN